MNLQIFPNWGKKVGIVIFIIFAFLDGRDDFLRGYYKGQDNIPLNSHITLKDIGIFSFKEYFGENLMLLFGTLTFVGMLIYMLSKEKVEDDFINKLRLESYQLSFIGVTVLGLILHLLGLDAEFGLEMILSLLLVTYLIIFAIKKRSI